MQTPSDRAVTSGILGLLVGDALGVPFEFHTPYEIPKDIDFDLPTGFDRAHPGTPIGTWSDDGAQVLALLNAYRVDPTNLPEGMAAGLLAWYQRGDFTPDGRVFDVGVQTACAIDRLAIGTPVDQAGGTGEMDNGNGSLMRCLPVALWYADVPDAEEAIIHDACAQSLPTHGHPLSQACCAIYCLWAYYLLRGEERLDVAFSMAWGALKRHAQGPVRDELKRILICFDTAAGKGSGFVLDTLVSAHTCLTTTNSYKNAVRAAIRLGHDTDTTAAVVGGIAGIVYGVPEDWSMRLRGWKDVALPYVEAFSTSRPRSG